MDWAELFSTLSIGFLLGIRHAIEPDHVIAVSTVASQSKKLWKSSLIGVFWGIGHTVTLLLTGMVILFMKGSISEEWSMSLEFLVGIMLVYFGISTFRTIRNQHTHDETNHSLDVKVNSIKPMFMGLVHGLAGSAAMVLLTLSTVNSIGEGILYILIFGMGTIVGMLGFTTVLGIPFIMSSSKAKMNHTLTQVTGGISTIFGVYYMYNLGVTEGLFKLWIS